MLSLGKCGQVQKTTERKAIKRVKGGFGQDEREVGLLSGTASCSYSFSLLGQNWYFLALS